VSYEHPTDFLEGYEGTFVVATARGNLQFSEQKSIGFNDNIKYVSYVVSYTIKKPSVRKANNVSI
jgi:hypothetical protein